MLRISGKIHLLQEKFSFFAKFSPSERFTPHLKLAIAAIENLPYNRRLLHRAIYAILWACLQFIAQMSRNFETGP
jgi:hypothetical protein